MSWEPTASLDTLRFRSEVLQSLRSFFIKRRFLEVQTPVLSRDTVVDRHLDPITLSGQSITKADWAKGDWFFANLARIWHEEVVGRRYGFNFPGGASLSR